MRLFKCLSNDRVIPQNEKTWGVVHARTRGLRSSHTQLNYFVGFCNTTVNFKYNFTIFDFYVRIFCDDFNFIIFINWILELFKLFLKKQLFLAVCFLRQVFFQLVVNFERNFAHPFWNTRKWGAWVRSPVLSMIGRRSNYRLQRFYKILLSFTGWQSKHTVLF